MSEEPLYHDLPVDLQRSLDQIEQLIGKYGLPAGYRRIKWDEVTNNQEVYIYGTSRLDDSGYQIPRARGVAYGPHTVHSKLKRIMKNKSNQSFYHYSEDLLVPD